MRTQALAKTDHPLSKIGVEQVRRVISHPLPIMRFLSTRVDLSDLGVEQARRLNSSLAAARDWLEKTGSEGGGGAEKDVGSMQELDVRM